MRFRTINTVVATGLAALALAFAACGEGSEPDFSEQVPEGAPHVDQHSLSFEPSELRAAVGEKVYFTNSESALHKVAIDGEDVTGDMSKGDVAVYTFSAAGEYELTCPYHAQMKATVVVE